LSADEATNPLTADWSKIFLGYCDGASQSGFVQERVAVPAHGQDAFVYYRGKYILDALYDTFLSSSASAVEMHLAKEVILNGFSAGGLSVFLHADYLKAKIIAASAAAASSSSSSNVKVVAVPDAGFFLDIDSYDGTNVYTQNYKNVYTFQNCSSSSNSISPKNMSELE
jgi:hypothetical protein